MVYFNENPSFGGLDSPPIETFISSDGWTIGMTSEEWARYCAQVWDDCGPLNENENWIPEGEDRQEFIQLVHSYLLNAGYDGGGGIPSDDESSDDESSEVEDAEDYSDYESYEGYEVEDDESYGNIMWKV